MKNKTNNVVINKSIYKEAIRLFKEKLKKVYGSSLVDIILYGSIARREIDRESDVDILVLLKDYDSYWEELHKIGEIEFGVNQYFDFKVLISAIPALATDYENKNIPIFLNIKREGISLWKKKLKI